MHNLRLVKTTNPYDQTPTIRVMEGDETVVSISHQHYTRAKDAAFIERTNTWDKIRRDYLIERPENAAKINEAFNMIVADFNANKK